MCDIEHITSIAKFIKISPGKVELNKENVLVRTTKNESFTGYSTILSSFVRESNIQGIDREMVALFDQWFSYAKVFIDPATRDKQTAQTVLKELNEYLLNHTFLVGHTLSVADMAVFMALSPIVEVLHTNDKERFLHVSRWFNHVQLKTSLRAKKPINFATLQLSSFEVAAGH